LQSEKECPSKSHSDDLIDITASLELIISLGNNDKNLSIKTAFLLALVTASRPSDLTRLDLSTARVSRSSYSFDCIDPKEFKIAVSHYQNPMIGKVTSGEVGKFALHYNSLLRHCRLLLYYVRFTWTKCYATLLNLC